MYVLGSVCTVTQGKPNYSSAYQWHSLLAHCTLQKKQFKMEAHILE